MRRNLITVLALFGLLACSDTTTAPLPDADYAASAADAGALVAQASGGMHWTLLLDGVLAVGNDLTFNARKYADGSVDGTLRYVQTVEGQEFRFLAKVTCLSVYDGNRAKYGALIVDSNDVDFTPGFFIWFQSIDNGEGANAPADGSSISGFGDEAANEAFCASPNLPNLRFFADVTEGNLQVWAE